MAGTSPAMTTIDRSCSPLPVRKQAHDEPHRDQPQKNPERDFEFSARQRMREPRAIGRGEGADRRQPRLL
jgi:hypothetical protein